MGHICTPKLNPTTQTSLNKREFAPSLREAFCLWVWCGDPRPNNAENGSSLDYDKPMKKSATDKLPRFYSELLTEATGPNVYPRGVASHAEDQDENRVC